MLKLGTSISTHTAPLNTVGNQTMKFVVKVFHEKKNID